MGFGPFTGAVYPLIDPFNSRTPTTVVYQSNTEFDGTQQLNPPVVGPGLLTHPPQAGGGLFIPGAPVIILEALATGGGTLTITKTTAGIVTTIASLAALANTPWGPSDILKVTSSGSTNPTLQIIAQLAPLAAGA